MFATEPAQIQDEWQAADAAGTLGPSPDHCWRVKSNAYRTMLTSVEGLVKGRRLLDVGGGTGHFAAHAATRGWVASVQDVSELALQQAGQHPGVAVLPGPLQDLDLPSDSFDLVTMWCVAAHVPDILPLLIECRRLLAPKGLIFLTAPNAEFHLPYARLLRVAGQTSMEFDSPWHRLHFNRTSLARLLRSAEFVDLRFVHYGTTARCVCAGQETTGVFAQLKGGYYAAAKAISRLSRGRVELANELQVLASKC